MYNDDQSSIMKVPREKRDAFDAKAGWWSNGQRRAEMKRLVRLSPQALAVLQLCKYWKIKEDVSRILKRMETQKIEDEIDTSVRQTHKTDKGFMFYYRVICEDVNVDEILLPECLKNYMKKT